MIVFLLFLYKKKLSRELELLCPDRECNLSLSLSLVYIYIYVQGVIFVTNVFCEE